MLDQITPVLLTRNEACNIERTLDRLAWARDIVVVDSCSDDETGRLVAQFARTRMFWREFDTHAKQWDFALNATRISTEWVLALDADYVLSDELVTELASLKPRPGVHGYRAPFVYVVHGRPLRGSAYPPVTILYRRHSAKYIQDGHTQRVVIDGFVESLTGSVLHDDRKPLGHWVESQRRYMKLEAQKLACGWDSLSWKDRIRKMKVVAPIAVGFYCLFVKGAILDGTPGLFYALQRVFSEILLALYLIDEQRGTARKVCPIAEVVEPQ